MSNLDKIVDRLIEDIEAFTCDGNSLRMKDTKALAEAATALEKLERARLLHRLNNLLDSDVVQEIIDDFSDDV